MTPVPLPTAEAFVALHVGNRCPAQEPSMPENRTAVRAIGPDAGEGGKRREETC